MKKRSLLLACLLVAGLSTTAFAHVPKKVAYQGFLATAAGAPVDSTVSVTFRLYTAASGGSPLWAETQSVAVANGLYSVTLGADTPLDLDFANPLYLGVSVGADPEMSPRQALSSVPYALRALSVEEGAVGAGAIVDGSIVPSKLANCGLNEILKFTGSGWACSADADTTVAPGNSVTAATSFGQASAAGASVQYARADHTHGTPAAPVIPAAPVFHPIGGQVASIAGGAGAFEFVGPTASVTVASTQTRVAGVVSAVLGTVSGTTTARVSLCFQLVSGGAINDLSVSHYLEPSFGPTRATYTASAARSGLPAGTYNMGLCIRNLFATAIDNNNWMQGWFQVVNP